jgi:FixJ family two-component response regulator
MPPEPERELICILDDDPSVRDSIEQLLDSDELRARSFEDAEDFLAHARSHPVPLALLDVWMSNMNGLEVQSRLREVSPDTKVIAMTGRETATIRAAALEGGAFAFFLKPFADEAFLSLIRQGLRSATGNDIQTRYLTTKMG